ncbi:MAG: patatin-like phospholipase family protein, partial [bacterium]
GLSFLKELNRRANLNKPKHIIGLTAYSELKNEVRDEFEQNGWVIITYNIVNGEWEEVIKNKIDYISGNGYFPLEVEEQNEKPYFALIMKGGGIKGLAYVGALEELTKYYKFNWYAGTSAGAISAILLSSGYSVEELKKELSQKNFSDFKDANYLKRILNLFTKHGLFEAYTFEVWLNNLLNKKINNGGVAVELKDLKYRTTVYASRREKSALVFDSTDIKTRDNRAVFAARCSMSIPFFFTPQKSEGLNVFDGGAQNNYPVKRLLSDNPDTKFIGLYLGPKHYELPKKSGFLGIFREMISIWMEAMDYEALKLYKNETIRIDTRPISTLKFKLNNLEKDFLMRTGKIAALEFLIENNKIKIEETELKQERKLLQQQRVKLRKKKQRRKWLRRSIFSLLLLAIILKVSVFTRNNQTSVKTKPNSININDSGNQKIIFPFIDMNDSMEYSLKLFPTDEILIFGAKESLDSLNTGLGWQTFDGNIAMDNKFIVAGEKGKSVTVRFKGKGAVKTKVIINNYKDSIRGNKERWWE